MVFFLKFTSPVFSDNDASQTCEEKPRETGTASVLLLLFRKEGGKADTSVKRDVTKGWASNNIPNRAGVLSVL